MKDAPRESSGRRVAVKTKPDNYTGGKSVPVVWMNCYHPRPVGATLDGSIGSGIARENHAATLEHHQRIKNLLVGYRRLQ